MDDKMWKRWINSEKYKQLQYAIENRKKSLLNIKSINYKKYIKEKIMMTKKEMENILDNIIEFDGLTDQEKEAFDWVDDENAVHNSKDEIIIGFTQTVIHWSFYLVYYEKLEQYELCAKIRDVILIELNEVKRLINNYFISEQNDDDSFDNIVELARVSMYKNYINYLKNSNED